MEETNVSVPKANLNSSTPNLSTDGISSENVATGVGTNAAKKAGSTSGSIAADIGAKSALQTGAMKGAAALGQQAVNGTASLLSNIANGVSNFLGNTVGAVFHAVGNFVGGIASSVSGFFGGVGAAASTFFTTCFTAVAVTTSAVAGVGAATSNNDTAVITDYATYTSDDCAPGQTNGITNLSSENDKGVSLGTEGQQKNAYIIYNTFYKWFNDTLNTGNAENQAYGVLANILRECGYNPACLETGERIEAKDYESLSNYTRGIGLVQWTVYKPDSHKKSEWISTYLANWFQTNNLPWNTLDSQLRLLISGDDPLYGRMKKYIKNSKELSDTECDVLFLKHYEIPAIENVIRRQKEAKKDIAKVRLDVKHYAETHATSSAETTDGSKEESDTSTVTESDQRVNDILTFGANMSNESGSDGTDITSTVEESRTLNCVSQSNLAATGKSNADIARAAVSFAWPTKERATGNNGTKAYRNIYDTVFSDRQYYMSCDRAVYCAIAWSGADDDCVLPPTGGVDGLLGHFQKCDRWQNMGKVECDTNGMPTNCLPGDILLITSGEKGTTHGHVKVYTGNEIIKELQPNAPEGANCVAASFESRSAGCEIHTSTSPQYTIWRCVNPQNSLVFAKADEGIKDLNAGTRADSSTPTSSPASDDKKDDNKDDKKDNNKDDKK